MFKSIRKRDGRIVRFKPEKITEAILKAGKASGEIEKEFIAKRLMLKVLSIAEETIQERVPTVEEIQEIIEEVLLSSRYKETAKSFILYRYQHRQMREIAEKMQVDIMDEYIDGHDWKVRENANMTFSLQGLHNYISSEVSKTYWLNKVYPEKIKNAHLSGDFHIHDLGMLSVYCVGWDLLDLLQVGFKGARGKIESKPAKHFRSALGQVVNFFYTLQGEAAGAHAQAFSNFDTLLAPFIRYDNLDYEGVKQSIQEFLFNINIPTRVGFQSPFTNITFDLQPPSYLSDFPVILGGESQNNTYSDFQDEIDTFNKAFLEVMLEGDAKNRVFTFPIPTYNITKDFDWDNEILELLWRVTGKYGIPYFANFVNSDMKPEDARSMCCRLRLDTRKLRRKGGGLFGANPLTGSIGVVTINMPRVGYLSKNEDDFIERLDKLMDLAKESLEIKRKVLERLTDKNLYPYSKFYLRNIKKRFDEYWKNHFSTIGLIGMNEACLNLNMGDIGTNEGKSFAIKVLEHMRNRLVEFQNETGNNYNLEATPAEGTSYRLAMIDKKKYDDIICGNEAEFRNGAEPFYTNSSQLPVNYTNDMFEALDLQDEIQNKYTGGTVLHLFLGEQISNPTVIKELVRKISSNYSLPYFTITPTFSICPTHGYLAGEIRKCPKCGSSCEVYSRVVGYLRPVDQWNKGKQEEFKQRKTFKVGR